MRLLFLVMMDMNKKSSDRATDDSPATLSRNHLQKRSNEGKSTLYSDADAGISEMKI